MPDEHRIGRDGEMAPGAEFSAAAEQPRIPERPKRLTDMDLPDYSVEQAKAERQANKRAARKRMKRDSVLDEEGEAVIKDYDQGMMRRLLGYLRPYRKQFILGVSLLLVYSVLVPAFPALIALALDRYVVASKEPFASLSMDERLNGLLWVVLAYLGLRLVNFGLRYGYTYVVAWLGQHIVFDIRRQIFEKIQRLHMGFFDRTPVGRLITRITSDVEAIQTMMTDGLVGLVADVGLIVGLTVYMFSLNWRMALITLAVMPLLFIALNYIRVQQRTAYRAVRLRTSISNAYLAENLSGMRTVQLFNREQRNARRYDKLNLDLLDANFEQVRWFSLFHPTVQLTSSIATGLILFYAGSALLGDAFTGVVTIGMLVAYIQYSSMFFRPLQELSDKFNILQAAMASSE
ncbi:MAG TPA: ABC transporter ATP-binding protein, partial [Trueperaceae bacterium]|nr:ABC transporter ATP-binding protein [Trueperaceae bacterium]